MGVAFCGTAIVDMRASHTRLDSIRPLTCNPSKQFILQNAVQVQHRVPTQPHWRLHQCGACLVLCVARPHGLMQASVHPPHKPQATTTDTRHLSSQQSAPLLRRRLVQAFVCRTSASSSVQSVVGLGRLERPRTTNPTKTTTTTKQTKPRRRRVRVRIPTPCTTPGCDNFAVTKGVCVRHGGGAHCEFEGCEKRAKMNKRCFQHGGYRQCLQPECTSKAKRYGYCWAHGGGINCTAAGCDKVSTQGGLCWAHGGGSRCRVTGCTRRSYQKDEYYCSHHRVNGSSDESAMG